MKYFSNKHRFTRGMTLVETLIYIGLVSILLSGFITFAYEIHSQLFRLNDDIYDEETK